MGNTKRKDNFTTKGGADMPGPGNYGDTYSSFSKTQKIPLGGKYKNMVSETPGPGSYAANDNDRSRKGATMGTQARKDPFEASKKAAAQLPGPGNYVESTDTFGKGKGTGFGSKYKESKNSNPGPGQYDADKNKLKGQTATAKMGTT